MTHDQESKCPNCGYWHDFEEDSECIECGYDIDEDVEIED